MLILLAGQMVNSMTGSVAYLMTITGQQNEVIRVFFFSVLINVIGNFCLIPWYGTVGAAVATALSVIFWNILLFIRVIKTMGLNPTIIPFKILR